MSSKRDRLTLEQIDLIPKYTKKWQNISLSTKAIDPEETEKVVNAIYQMLGRKIPIILFFDSPYAASKFVINQTFNQLNKLFGQGKQVDNILYKWHKKFLESIYSQINIVKIYSQVQQLDFVSQFDSLKGGIIRWEGIDYQIGNYLWQQLEEQSQNKIQRYLGQKLYRFIRPGVNITNSICRLDYLIDVFNLAINKENWEIYKSLLTVSNYIFLQEKACIICNRPIKMSFDTEGFLHKEGEPAIQFADGYCLYSYHGVTLPETYGKLHLEQWQPQWLLIENNIEVREALVKGIGYKKICSRLSVKEIDCWYNFLLIAVKISHNSKAVYLLKINVDTAQIDCVKEVPEDTQSVCEAASFVDGYENWDIASAELEGFEIPF